MDFAHLVAGFDVGGRYRIERPIKAGGMGAVYVAMHTQTGRRVALKVMHPDIVADPDMRRRFAQEARVSAMVRSRHVVDVLDAGVDDRVGAAPFLVMELLEGEELGERIRGRGALPPSEALVYLEQLATGLQRAHDAGFVHRDLKPENLFIVRDPDLEGAPLLKILDFGIAKLLQGAMAQSTLGGGTPYYMAPEQTGHDAITRTADVWAYGLVAYTMLVGRPYWSPTTVGELYGDLLRGDYPSAVERARTHGVALPSAFDSFFFRCVALAPSERFATVSEAFAALRVAFEGQARVVVRSSPPAFSSTQSPISPLAPTMPTPVLAAPREATAPSPSKPTSASTDASAIAASAHPSSARRGPGRAWTIVAAALILGGGLAYAARGLLTGASAGTPGAAATGASLESSGAPLPHTSQLAKKRSRVVELAAGDAHTCVRFDDGEVACWGRDQEGQLGDAGDVDRLAPRLLPGIDDATSIAVGGFSTCVVRASGRLACFGLFANAKEALALHGVQSVSINYGSNLCARLRDGRVDCVGRIAVRRDADHTVSGLRDVQSVVVGYEHACALSAGGDVMCWGQNDSGQLGDDGHGDSDTPLVVAGVRNVVQLTAGHAHTCARRKEGTVVCWGDNDFGALGRATESSEAGVVPGVTGAIDVSAGTNVSCALERGGTVKCWGNNSLGQLGVGARGAPKTSRDAHGVEVFAQSVLHVARGSRITVGESHACALLDSASVQCWGSDDHGQLGFESDEQCGDTACATTAATLDDLTARVDALAADAGAP